MSQNNQRCKDRTTAYFDPEKGIANDYSQTTDKQQSLKYKTQTGKKIKNTKTKTRKISSST